MKSVLWVEVLQLAQDREHFLLPHLDKDHLMDQDGNLERERNRRGCLEAPDTSVSCVRSTDCHLSQGHQQVLDKLIVHGRGIQYRLNVKFLNILMLPEPPVNTQREKESLQNTENQERTQKQKVLHKTGRRTQRKMTNWWKGNQQGQKAARELGKQCDRKQEKKK